MAEQTTTDEQVQDTGAQALPEDGQQDAAALQANEQNDSQTQGDASASVPAVDDKLQSFAKGLGIEDVTSLSERELKLLKVAKDNQAEYQRNAQRASELEKTLNKPAQQQGGDEDEEIDPGQLALKEIASLKLQQGVNDFLHSKAEYKEHEQDMVKLVNERPMLADLVKQEALSLEDLYRLSVSGEQAEEAKTQGAKEALQNLAIKQQAGAVPGVATTSAMTPQKGDPLKELWSK